MRKQKSIQIIGFTAFLLMTPRAFAQPHPWPFDFDPQIAADPAGIESRLQDLGNGVPPIPSGDLVATDVGPVTLYFHADMLELLQRAFASGPGFVPLFARVPQQCAQHAAFTFPSLLVAGASSSCLQTEQQLRAAFSDEGQSCLRIEFPELYVYDQAPGEVDHDDLKNLEGLIRVVGEPLSHIDYHRNLLPDSFEHDTRVIIAKIRYQTLLNNARARRGAYGTAKEQLRTNETCFVRATAQTLLTTIDALIAELDVVEQDLEDLYADGLAQAAADRRAVEAQGRLRNDLPHPALTDHERELLALYIGGLYWRMRGSALLDYPDSGLQRRWLYVEFPYQVIADITGGADATDLGRDIFINETWGYADWMDIGDNPGNDKYSDMVDMAIRGKRTLDLAQPHLEERGYDTAYLYAGGLQMGPCYYYGWYPLWYGQPPRYFQLGEDLPDPYMWFLECPTAHGEFCTGAALGIGLARTLLWGKPNEGCIPQCGSNVCGTDLCNGSCGSCDPGFTCELGRCVRSSTDAGHPDASVVDNGGDDRIASDVMGVDRYAQDVTRPDIITGDTSGLDLGRNDAAAANDSSETTTPGNGGCDCRGQLTSANPGFVAFLVAVLFVRRQRRP